jgi:hypothetical protein
MVGVGVGRGVLVTIFGVPVIFTTLVEIVTAGVLVDGPDGPQARVLENSTTRATRMAAIFFPLPLLRITHHTLNWV